MKKWAGMLLAAASVLVIAGCGGEQAAAPQGSAQKELSGKVVVYMPSPKGLNKAYVKGFENKHKNVKVELFEGTTGEILARLATEKSNPVADVVVLASWSDGLAFQDKNKLVSFVPANSEKMHEGWSNKEQSLFGTSASAMGVIYNKKAFATLDADWGELADAKYNNVLAIPDPLKSGSCKDFLAGYVYATDSNWTAFEGMAKNNMKVAGANKAALEAVITGEKGILVAGVDYNAYENIKKGEPIDIYYPKSGTVINPRPAMVLESSKNQANAKAFVEYMLSDEAQKMVADAYLLPGRKDIRSEKRKNVDEIPVLKTDWLWMSKNSMTIAEKLKSLLK
ncbi:MAG TPA: ABC transporter substrate-binding protein [Candidatus Avacidaminococcus intestinavium]|uniref:ABC transporter substrate-binding protein n=1 Tax=Candidatus Avacidaminococcus intestinavium TaxID=2840684 RepID=A0A9D1MPI6_9FIRM|nr:ABC transporter substrate-binding protein [Candidatus Avacidaminococcus intestinavium]